MNYKHLLSPGMKVYFINFNNVIRNTLPKLVHTFEGYTSEDETYCVLRRPTGRLEEGCNVNWVIPAENGEKYLPELKNYFKSL